MKKRFLNLFRMISNRNYCYHRVCRNIFLENHIARTVNRIIDRLDITSLIHSYDPEGAPAYHPCMMLTVLIYGMLIGIRSSRKIEALLKDSLVFMHLSGRQAPDFRTNT